MADPVSILSLVLANPIVDRIIESAASLIQEEFHLLRGVGKEFENLMSNLTAIKAVLQDAENKQRNDSSLKDWLEKLQNAAYDAEDTLDMFQTEAFLWKQKQEERKIKRPFSVSGFSLKLTTAHKIKEISARIERIAEERKKFNLDTTINTVVESSQIHPHTSFVVDTKDVVGRESDKEKIINVLLSDEFDKDGEITVIPIIGMGGLGKTTLAQLIFNDERVKNHFDLGRMWVCVTVDFNLIKILVDIMESYSKMKVASNLSDNQIIPNFVQFLSGKRYLLVLDDVWIEDYKQWELLRRYLNHGENGSKVIVTSRMEIVSTIMGTQPPHRLGFLPEPQYWSLFEKIAFTDDNLLSSQRKNLEDTGKEIVGKCKGLPLAVKAMGGLLRGNVDINKWRRILRSHIWELEEGNLDNKPKILPALKLSYDYLPLYLKQCFAYCSIFPKAYAFDRSELVKHWMAHKFIHTIGQERKEETGHEYFNELLVRSFFQVQYSVIDHADRYYMHDLIHDLAQLIARLSHHYCLVKDERSCNTSQNSRHVSLLCEDVQQPALNIVQKSKKLRTLLFPSECLKNFGQALEKIFHELRYIRVLNLSSSMIKELPNSIEELKLLSFLDLSRTEIKALPNSICNLYNLQTLKLLRCPWFVELPKDFSKLVKLRHLQLDDIFWFKLSTLPPGIGKLTSLHNLLAFQVGHESGYRMEELRDMADLTGRLHVSKLENAVKSGDSKLSEKENLEKLVLEWSERDINPQDEAAEEQVLEGLRPHGKPQRPADFSLPGCQIPNLDDRWATSKSCHCFVNSLHQMQNPLFQWAASS